MPLSKKRRLYGRTVEVAALRQWYMAYVGLDGRDTDDADQRSDTRSDTTCPQPHTPQLVLLSGPVGVGKRALVQAALAEIVASTGGMLLTGRFRPPHISRGQNDNGKDNNDASTVVTPRLKSTLANANDIAMVGEEEDLSFSAFHDVARCLYQDFLDGDSNGTLGERLAQHFSSDEMKTLRQVLMRSSSDTNGLWQGGAIFSGGISADHPEDVPNGRPFVSATPLRAFSLDHRTLLARLIRVVASCRPLVLHLEQMQWADPHSLVLLRELLLKSSQHDGECKSTRGLFIIASFSGVDQSIAFLLQESTRSSASQLWNDPVRHIQLENLAYEDVYQWVTNDSLSMRDDVSDATIRLITDDVYATTLGNPRNVRYTLQYLVLSMDNQSVALSSEDRLRDHLRTAATVCGCELFGRIVQKLDSQLQNIVKVVAALGECGQEGADVAVLETVLRVACSDSIQELVQMGLLESTCGRVQFSHPDLQVQAYEIIPECNRAAFHLRIGRRIWKNSKLWIHNEATNNAPLLFIVVRHLQIGIEMVTDVDELDLIAFIGLKAGRQAMQLSAFSSAVSYFEFALSVLGDRQWESRCYALTLALYDSASEAHYCTATFDRMEALLNAVFRNASAFQDKLQAYTTLVFSNGNRNRLDAALDMAFRVLIDLSEPIPRNPDVHTISAQFARTKRMLQRKTDRFFLNLPRATNATKVAAMQMLSFTMMYAYEIRPKYSLLAGLRILELCLEYGMCPPAITAFTFYGYLLCAQAGQIDEGVRFGQIALALLDQCQSQCWLPRVYLFVYSLINPFKYPLREALEPLVFARRSGLNTGDLECSMILSFMHVHMAFHTGTMPLSELEETIRSYCHVMNGLGQVLGLLCLVPMLAVVCDLAGTTNVNVAGDIPNAEAALERAASDRNRVALFHYYLYQVKCYCFCNRYQEALDVASKAWRTLSEDDPWLTFYEGLASLAAVRRSRSRSRWLVGRRSIQKMKRWAKICPANFANKHALLKAERNAQQGYAAKAMSCFNTSIEIARREGFVQEEALAYERFAQFHCRSGNCSMAALCFEAARLAYERWGARALVEHMEEHLRRLAA